MQKKIGLLTALLAAQLILALGLGLGRPAVNAAQPSTPLLALGDQPVDRLEIQGPDKQTLLLQKTAGRWVLPDSAGFPADKSKVERLLGELKALKRGLAVATTAGAQQRFKVSDDDFERKLVLAQGDKTLATVYFGTSPGLRQVHARSARDSAVYTTGFGLYEAPLGADAWEDKTLLRVPADDIRRIEVAVLALSPLQPPHAAAAKKTAQGAAGPPPWSATGLDDGEVVDQAHAADLVQQVSQLTFASVLGTRADPAYGLEQPALTLELTLKDGKREQIRLGRREKQNDYVLQVSSRPEYFRLTSAAGAALIKSAQRNQLVTSAKTSVAAKTPSADAKAAATKPPAASASPPPAVSAGAVRSAPPSAAGGAS